MPHRRALEVVRELLDVLARLHASGQVHGAIRPDTVLVSSTAVELAAPTAADPAAAARNLLYSAPELESGSVDARTDLYAVGAILFELLSGRPPFFADDAAALRRLHAYTPVPTLARRAPDRTFPAALESIVAQALAKQRADRFQTATAMIAAIDHALSALPAEPAAAPAPTEPIDPDDSLVRYAEEVKRHRAAVAPPPLPPLAPPPVLDFTSDAEEALVPARQSRTPLLVIGAIAGVVIIAAIAVATCRGDRAVPPLARPPLADAAGLPPDAPAIEVAARCARLGTTCGDMPKHEAKITAECEQALAALASECRGAAVAAFECYEQELCGSDDKIWAYADLGVLAERRGRCAAERAALATCAGAP